MQLSVSAHRGPIPSAEELAKYEALLPGLADRIVRQAEGQTEHRQGLERTALNGELTAGQRGTYCGLAIGMGALLAATILGIYGQQWAASIIGGCDIVGLAGVFVYGSQTRRTERMEKAKMMSEK